MITLCERGIRWDREDVRLMAKIIGSEHAVIGRNQRHGWSPPLPSILKLASSKGAILSRAARSVLKDEEARRDFIQELKSLADASIPDASASKFFAHQRADLHLMYATNFPAYLLAHQPGVGKTLVAIRYAEHVGARRIAIITPNAAKDQWADEIMRWSDDSMPARIVDGTVRAQIRIIKREQHRKLFPSWTIGHWESLVHAREGWLDTPWDMVILDEAQHISNRQAQRTDTAHAMALRSKYRLALSGHPFTNSTHELFSILKFLYPKLYTSFWRWAHLQIQIDEGAFGGLDLSEPRRPSLLKWEIAPFVLRRTKKQVWPNLPAITRVRRMAVLSSSGRREYDKLRKQFFVELKAHKGEKNILAIPSVLARITRLRQYLIDPGILGAKEPSVKYPIIHELIQDMDGKPPVIFTMYRRAAMRLQTYLRKRGVRVKVLAGGMKRKTKSLKRQFLNGHLDAIIILISVGGTALNFGKYGYVIHLDLPWNPRDYEQTEGRVDRPVEGTGKLVPVTSYRVIVKDSYEERMEDKNRDKHADFSKVFSVNDAKELFA
jgi:SNF2 family DNA or RNA helicase